MNDGADMVDSGRGRGRRRRCLVLALKKRAATSSKCSKQQANKKRFVLRLSVLFWKHQAGSETQEQLGVAGDGDASEVNLVPSHKIYLPTLLNNNKRPTTNKQQ